MDYYSSWEKNNELSKTIKRTWIANNSRFEYYSVYSISYTLLYSIIRQLITSIRCSLALPQISMQRDHDIWPWYIPSSTTIDQTRNELLLTLSYLYTVLKEIKILYRFCLYYLQVSLLHFYCIQFWRIIDILYSVTYIDRDHITTMFKKQRIDTYIYWTVP